MKTLLRLMTLVLLTGLYWQCREDEEIVPATVNDPGVIIEKDSSMLSVSGDSTVSFIIKGEDRKELNDGYEIRGTVYQETDSGRTVLVTGDIRVTENEQGELLTMEGTVLASIPDIGIFESFTMDKSPMSFFEYNRGRYFKALEGDYKDLPLQDDQYYFHFNSQTAGVDELVNVSVGNSKIGMSNYFVDVEDPTVIISGGYVSFATPSGPVKIGNRLDIGISQNGTLPFKPKTYQDTTLNRVIEAEGGFDDINGHLYLVGEMGLTDQVPMKINGSMIMGFHTPNLHGLEDFFNNGMYGSTLEMGMNGELVFGHDLIDLLPVDVEAKLTNVTLTYTQTKEKEGELMDTQMKFAGDFEDNAWIKKILGTIHPEVEKNMPLTGNHGAMYASFSNKNTDELALFFKLGFGLNLPITGEQTLRHGSFYINDDKISISGGVGVPFDLGEMWASGTVDYNGKFELMGSLIQKTALIDGMDFDAELQFAISNDKYNMEGNVQLPHGIGGVDVSGDITAERFRLTGLVSSDIDFGKGVRLPAVLNFSNTIERESDGGMNKTMQLSGSMYLKPTSMVAEVEASFHQNDLVFTGQVADQNFMAAAGKTNFVYLPVTDLTVYASTRTKTLEISGLMSFSRFGTLKVGAELYPDDFIFKASVDNENLKVGSLYFPANNFNIDASYKSGMTFGGDLTLPNAIGKLRVSGYQTYLKFALNGKFITSNWYLADQRMSVNLTVSIGSENIGLSGKLYSPFGVDFGLSGTLTAENKVNLKGFSEFKLGTGDLNVNGTISTAITNTSCSIGFEKGTSFNLFGFSKSIDSRKHIGYTWDYANPKLKLCASHIGLSLPWGDECIDIDKNMLPGL